MYFSAVHYSPLLARGPLASFSWCPLLSSWPASPSSSWLVPHFMSWQAWASWHDVEQHPHGPAVWLDSDILVLHINACIFPQSTTVHSWPERLASFSWCPLLFSWPVSPSSSWLVHHLMSWLFLVHPVMAFIYLLCLLFLLPLGFRLLPIGPIYWAMQSEHI